MYDYYGTIYNVVDGDTVDVDIDLGFHVHLRERVRILDLDTPENRGAEREIGRAITAWCRVRFTNEAVILHTEKAPSTDCYGRWLASIVLRETGESIRDLLTANGCNKLSPDYSEERVREFVWGRG